MFSTINSKALLVHSNIAMLYFSLKVGAWRLLTDVYDLYNIWTTTELLGGEIYIRLSVNIYCTITDYERLRDAILELQQEPPTSDRQKKRIALFKEKEKNLALK